MKIFLLTLCLFLFPQVSHAKDIHKEEINNSYLSQWSEIPIAHEGRIKPLDSFARIILKQISGHEFINNLSAKKWLAEVIFDPSSAMEKKIFKVKQPDTFHLPKRKNKLYSYIEISSAIDKNKEIIAKLLKADKQDLLPEQHEMIRVFENYILMTQTLRSLTSILPLPFKIPTEIKSSSKEITNYLDLKSEEENINNKVKKIIKQKGTNPTAYNTKELQIADISFQLRVIEEGGKNNNLLKIIPENINGSTEWISPWEAILNGKGSPQSAKYLKDWQQMAIAYQNKNNEKFYTAIKNAKTYAPKTIKIKRLKIEQIFNSIPLKNMATAIYFIILSLISILFFLNIKTTKLLKNIIIFMFSAGVLAHASHIGIRIFILDRPPVGTLYESVLFVSFICALTMLFVSLKQQTNKQLNSIFIGSIIAFLLLSISNGLTDSNNMQTLSAVLNTNFWLATHVLCITIGYGFSILTGTMAHIYLFNANKENQNNQTNDYFKTITTISVFALLFMAIGTILGGIWADQSWGRFWGWDPKENGALLIVLWLIWIIHSRISGNLGKIGFAVGAATLNIIVILSWFGVNLLNIGLHSYGFIEGIAVSIAVFCLIEITIISSLYIRTKRFKAIKI